MSLSDGQNEVAITAYGRGPDYVYTDSNPLGWAFVRVDGRLRLITGVKTNQTYYWIYYA